MKTATQNSANETSIPYITLGDAVESYSPKHTLRPIIFNLGVKGSFYKGDETEVTVTISGDDTAISATVTHKTKPAKQIDNDEVVKMLESWLQEEPTEEDKTLWKKLESELQNEQISFSEIDVE